MSAAVASPSFPTSGSALIASPSGALRAQIVNRLNGRCRPVHEVAGGADALANLETADWEVLFLDRKLPDLDSDELLMTIRSRFPGTDVVLLDADNEEPAGSESRPICAVAGRVRPLPSFPEAPLPAASEVILPLPGMIGASEAMRRVYRMVRLVAERSTTVLIEGPTGTGKELVARAVHALSPRASKPFVVVNCAAIPESLLESELFGFTRGAFTGAIQSQPGRVAAAHGGTLFLDEVGELPLGMQAKLLRFLEQKEIQRLGTAELTRVDVRVVAASNVDLGRRAARGDFRQDLFYRLAAFPIELPRLSDRRCDIVPLAEHFLTCMSAALRIATPRLTAEAVRILENHSWGGNVRELQHVMERASILAEGGDVIDAAHLYFSHCDGCGDGLARS